MGFKLLLCVCALATALPAQALLPTIHCGFPKGAPVGSRLERTFKIEEGIDHYYLELRDRGSNNGFIQKLTKTQDWKMYVLNMRFPKIVRTETDLFPTCLFNSEKPLLSSCLGLKEGIQAILAQKDDDRTFVPPGTTPPEPIAPVKFPVTGMDLSTQEVVRESVGFGLNGIDVVVQKNQVFRIVISIDTPGFEPAKGVSGDMEFNLPECAAGELPDFPSQ